VIIELLSYFIIDLLIALMVKNMPLLCDCKKEKLLHIPGRVRAMLTNFVIAMSAAKKQPHRQCINADSGR
jgi:hypothetical protein